MLGVDVVPALIDGARRHGGGRFDVMAYETLAVHGLTETFDVCVCNFSLLGESVTNRLVAAIPSLVIQGGLLIVQTLHPWMACSDEAYRDGWQHESWLGIEADFAEPAPWYFRTLASWTRLFSESGFRIEAILEPLNPETGRPALMILIGRPFI